MMPDDENVLLPLEFHDDRLQSDDNIPVGFAAAITIVEFVVVAVCEVFGVRLLKETRSDIYNNSYRNRRVAHLYFL